MKRTALIAAGIAALLLAGCSAGPGGDGDKSEIVSSSAAPLVAETPVAGHSSEVSAKDAFLADVRHGLPTNTQIPDATDEQLFRAGVEACEKIAAGAVPEEISVIDGEVMSESGYYRDSLPIIQAAIVNLCDR